MPIVGTCTLCQGKNVELKDSHIVSKWTYRRLVGYAATAAPNPVMVADGASVLTSKQVTEYLLCGTCENRLSVRENYASKIGVQPNGSFPAKDTVNVVQSENGVTLADAQGLDVDALTYFAVSVFWRADVGQIDPIVNLGRAREDIRRYLLGQLPLPADVDLFVSLIVPEQSFPRIDRIIAFPATSSESGVERHDFTACGIRFTMYAGGEMPTALTDVSFPRKKVVFISDGRSLLNSVAREVVSSPAKGSLASRT
jgi:hypothetical protein